MPMMDKGKDSLLKEVLYTKYYKENYGHYFTKGLVIPSHQFYKWLYVVSMIVLHAPAHYKSLMVAYEEDFSEFTELLHFAVLLILSVSGILTADQAKVVAVIKNFEKGIDNYKGTLDDRSRREIKKIRLDRDNRKQFRSKFMIFGLYAASFSIIILRPIYDFISGKYSRPNLFKDNINRYLPVMLWCPFDVATWYGVVYTFAFEYYVILQTTFIVIASTVWYLTTCEELCYNLCVLNVTLRNVKERALLVGNGELKKEILQDCLGRNVKHHNNIIECFDTFHQFFSTALWLIVTISTYLVCLAAYLISMEEIKLSHRITSILFLVFEIFHLLIYCAYGEEIQTLSSDTFNAVYDWDWIDCSIWIKKYSLIIQARSKTPLKLSCGGLMYANLNTFNNVCSSAYSYFNFLKASKSN